MNIRFDDLKKNLCLIIISGYILIQEKLKYNKKIVFW